MGLFWTAHRLHVRHVVRQLNLTVEARVDEHTHRARTARHAAAGFSGTSADVPAQRSTVAGPAGKRGNGRARSSRPVRRRPRPGKPCKGCELRSRDDRSASSGHRRGTDEEQETAPAIRVAAQGTPRRLKPVVGDEVYRITGRRCAMPCDTRLRNTSPPRSATTSGGSGPRARRWQGFDEQAVRRDPPAGHLA